MRLGAIWTARVGLGAGLTPAAFAQAMPEGWRFVLSQEGAKVPCAIVREGPVLTDPKAVNARVMRNNENKIVLVAARPDWDLNPDFGPTSMTLVVDGGAPVQMEAHPLGPLLLAVVQDAALTQKIRAAETVTWIVPWGEFKATVTGLGTAFDQTTLCPA